MLAKVPKIPRKCPKVHAAHMLAKVSKNAAKVPKPKCIGLSLLHAGGARVPAAHVADADGGALHHVDPP